MKIPVRHIFQAGLLVAWATLCAVPASNAQERDTKPEFQIPEVLIIDQDESEAFFKGKHVPGYAFERLGVNFPAPVLDLSLAGWPKGERERFVKPSVASAHVIPVSYLSIGYGSFDLATVRADLQRPRGDVTGRLYGALQSSSGYLEGGRWSGGRVGLAVKGRFSEGGAFGIDGLFVNKTAGVPYRTGEQRKTGLRLVSRLGASDIAWSAFGEFAAEHGRLGGDYGTSSGWVQVSGRGIFHRWGDGIGENLFLKLSGVQQFYRVGADAEYAGSDIFGSVSAGTVWRKSRPTWVRIGVRYDVFGSTSQVGPDLTVAHVLSQNLIASANLKSEFTPPSPENLYLERDFVEVNPELGATRSPWGLSLGLARVTAGEERVSVSGFLTQVRGIESWEDFNTDRLWRPFNLGERTLYGARVEIQERLSRFVTCGIRYLYRTWSGEALGYAPRHSAGAHVTLQWMVDISGECEASSGRFAPVANETDLQELPAYATLTARVSRRWGNWMAGVQVENVMDVGYEYVPGIAQPPRCVSGALSRSF